MLHSNQLRLQLKTALSTRDYKYLLDHLSRYHDNRDFNAFWNGIMPMFKHLSDLVYLLRGLRRFMAPNHKEMFDVEMKKHFIVE